MTKLRRFHGTPVVRLIVSVAASDVARLDDFLNPTRFWRGNRSEFVRAAIVEKLERDLMICGPIRARAHARLARPEADSES